MAKARRVAKLQEWARYGQRLRRRRSIAPRAKIPPLNGLTLVIDPNRFLEAAELIRQSGINVWEQGRLDEICCVREHSDDWLES